MLLHKTAKVPKHCVHCIGHLTIKIISSNLYCMIDIRVCTVMLYDTTLNKEKKQSVMNLLSFSHMLILHVHALVPYCNRLSILEGLLQNLSPRVHECLPVAQGFI